MQPSDPLPDCSSGAVHLPIGLADNLLRVLLPGQDEADRQAVRLRLHMAVFRSVQSVMRLHLLGIGQCSTSGGVWAPIANSGAEALALAVASPRRCGGRKTPRRSRRWNPLALSHRFQPSTAT
jgi:hypothetical protein